MSQRIQRSPSPHPVHHLPLQIQSQPHPAIRRSRRSPSVHPEHLLSHKIQSPHHLANQGSKRNASVHPRHLLPHQQCHPHPRRPNVAKHLLNLTNPLQLPNTQDHFSALEPYDHETVKPKWELFHVNICLQSEKDLRIFKLIHLNLCSSLSAKISLAFS